MSKEKSPIESASVSLGSGLSAGHTSHPVAQQTWTILVAGDFGCSARTPRLVRSASLAELVESSNIVLRGNAPQAGTTRQIFVEYPITSLKDFSAQSVKKQLPAIADLHHLAQTMAKLLEGGCSRAEALSSLAGHGEGLQLYAEAHQLLAQSQKSASRAAPPQPLSGDHAKSLDNILASVDLSLPGDPKPPAHPSTVDKLAEAITDDQKISLPKDAIARLIKRCEDLVDSQAGAVMREGFFAGPKASWLSLEKLAKTIGRKSEVNLLICSAPQMEVADTISAALAQLVQEGKTADVVLVDRDLSITNADMALLGRIAEIAEAKKAVVLSHLALEEQLLIDARGADTLKPIFKEDRFIPLARLRKTAQARNVVLAGPHVVIESREDSPEVSTGASWVVLFSMVESMLGGEYSLDIAAKLSSANLDTNVAFPLRHAAGIGRELGEDAAEMGLTLITKQTATQTGSPIKTLIDPEVAALQYTELGYNFVVNRLTRAVGQFVAATDMTQPTDSIAVSLKSHIADMLRAHGAILSAADIETNVSTSGEISVRVSSDVTVGGHPLQIQFGISA